MAIENLVTKIVKDVRALKSPETALDVIDAIKIAANETVYLSDALLDVSLGENEGVTGISRVGYFEAK